ncbi:unnamed protein product [Paramecium sonneborni]|uniref:C2 domain-containing protein n=1 Tax=Paramecium sonneborni TaxID=65129 RepID=A0A8S1QNZ6_9CILI|nr:unnamed protein product [Paramecium sonneborni]
MSLVGSGTLMIKPLKAKLTHDTEFLGKMDPYCKVIIGNQTQRTREHTDAGKHPTWNQSLSFRRTNEYLAEIQVWDSDEVSKDDLVGETSIALQKYLVDTPIPAEWINLSYKGKPAGQIYIAFEWFSDSKYQQQPQIPTNPQYYQQNNVIPMKPPGAPYYQQPYNQSIPYQQPPNYPPQQPQYPQSPPYVQPGFQGTLGYPQNPQQGYAPTYPANQQPGYQANPPQGYPPNQPPPNYPPNQPPPNYPPNQPPPNYPPNQPPPNYPPNQPPPNYPQNQPPPNYPQNQPPPNYPQNQPPPNYPANQPPPNQPPPNQQGIPNYAQTIQNNNPHQNQQPYPNNQQTNNYLGAQPQNYPNNQPQYPNNQMPPNQQTQTLPQNQAYPNQPGMNQQPYPNVPPSQQPPPQPNYVPPSQQQPPAFYPGQTLPQNLNYPNQTLPQNFDPYKIPNPMGN